MREETCFQEDEVEEEKEENEEEGKFILVSAAEHRHREWLLQLREASVVARLGLRVDRNTKGTSWPLDAAFVLKDALRDREEGEEEKREEERRAHLNPALSLCLASTRLASSSSACITRIRKEEKIGADLTGFLSDSFTIEMWVCPFIVQQLDWESKGRYLNSEYLQDLR